MFILFPVIAFVLLVMASIRRGIVQGLREGCCVAVVGCALFAVLVIEISSPFRAITLFAIVIGWGVLIAAAWAWWQKAPVQKCVRHPLQVNGLVISIALVGGSILAVTAMIACVAPPNTWDVMTYHLPRVMHWLSERSVAFYPTDIHRQNQILPGAEYLLLHVYVLTGGDRLVNLLQWAAFGGSGIAASLIARHLGARLPGQWLAGLTVLTIPMAILQSTGSKNDLVTAFWSSVAVLFWLKTLETRSWQNVLISAGAFSLAVLTKGTAVVLLPLFLVVAGTLIARERWTGAGKVAVSLLIVVAIALPWFVRYEADRRAFPEKSVMDKVQLTDLSLPCVVSNAAKQLTSQCAVPFSPLQSVCAGAVSRLHQWLGVKIDDPRTTGGSIEHILLRSHALHEDYAGSLLHVVLLGIGILLGLVFGGPRVRGYAGFIMIAAVIFVFTIKWQPWINRFHLPILVLAAPLLGVWLDRRTVLSVFVVIILALMAVPYLLWNKSRPVVGASNIFSVDRAYQYFWNRPDFLQSYISAASAIEQTGCRNVILKVGGDSWEYPLWALAPKGTRFKLWLRTDRTFDGEGKTDNCLIVAADQADMGTVMDVKGRVFKRAFKSPVLQIFAPLPGQ